jgi:hypothetical protein
MRCPPGPGPFDHAPMRSLHRVTRGSRQGKDVARVPAGSERSNRGSARRQRKTVCILAASWGWIPIGGVATFGSAGFQKFADVTDISRSTASGRRRQAATPSWTTRAPTRSPDGSATSPTGSTGRLGAANPPCSTGGDSAGTPGNHDAETISSSTTSRPVMLSCPCPDRRSAHSTRAVRQLTAGADATPRRPRIARQVFPRRVVGCPRPDLPSRPPSRVATNQDATLLVEAMVDDLRRHPDEWENQTLERFLDALVACLASGRDWPEQLSWRLLAEALTMASGYD